MKLLLIALSMLFIGCQTLPNKAICVPDGYKTAHCAFMLSGSPFDVDNSGSHQYTQDGRNWNYDQLIKYQLIFPPDSYKAIKEWFLKYCHSHSSSCNYQQAIQQFQYLEQSMQNNIYFEDNMN